MIKLTKNSVIGISVGTFFSLMAGMWLTVSEVQGYVTQITANTQAIQAIVRSCRSSVISLKSGTV